MSDRKILVIEDNPDDRLIIERMCRKAGFTNLVFAFDGKEGLEKAAAEQPDIVVTDTLLPGFDGFEVCRRIREAGSPDRPKIIVMTGSIDAVDAVAARRAGADDYAVKTSDCQHIIDALKKLA